MAASVSLALMVRLFHLGKQHMFRRQWMMALKSESQAVIILSGG